jgi:hypothetical protein
MAETTGKIETRPAVKQSPSHAQLHLLQNTLASINLRVGILAADPTCRWAQPDNLEALQRIVLEAMTQAHDLRDFLDDHPPPRRRARASGR